MFRKALPLVLLATALLLGIQFTTLFAVPPEQGSTTGQSATGQSGIGQTVPEYTGNDPLADDEPQLWQGRAVEVSGNNLVVKIEGERETFDVSPTADIRRNRKKSDLLALAPRDFVTIATFGDDRSRTSEKNTSLLSSLNHSV